MSMPAIREATLAPGTAAPAAGDGHRRPGAVTAGLALTYLTAATIPWTAVHVTGSISVGEVLLVIAAGVLLIADPGRRLPALPPWVWVLTVAVLVVGVTNLYFPASQAYMGHRDQLVDNYLVTHTAALPDTNLSVSLHLAVRMVLIPLVFGLAHGYDRRALSRVAISFVSGVAVGSLIAFLDSRHVTSIGPALTGVPVTDNRAAGLTDHPNVIAMTCVLALPLAVWALQAARGSARVTAVIGLVALLLGLYASRSRSGAVAAAVAGLVALAWLPRFRRHLPSAALILASLGAVLFVVSPGVGGSILSGLRLTGENTAGSDQARTIVNDQAVRDFLHSPFHGIGFEIAEQAHIVYLQALAVGGVILLAALLIYLGGALVRSARLARTNPLAIALFASVLGGAIFNAVQNALTPALVYLVEGLVAVLPLRSARRA
ncbi:MAG: O-antigen ligase domain-containing protein [Jatrophihabitans sp.]|nr:MAG: O-antigen ligase domain-containing protein [Jatrophihabitans sp.]